MGVKAILQGQNDKTPKLYLNDDSTLIQDKQDATDKVKEALNAADKDVLTDVSSTLNAHQVDYSMHVTSEEKSKIVNVVNPNLLDNWYFARPVNQRGKTEYTISWNQYCIDRWSVEADSFYIRLDSDGLYLKNNDTASDRRQFKQILLNNTIPTGVEVTASILCSSVIGDCGLDVGLSDYPYSNVCPYAYLKEGLTYTTGKLPTNADFKIIVSIPSGGEVKIKAIKLELGNTQTLAHKEGDMWVLNEVPDYGEQLRRCQRYFVRNKLWVMGVIGSSTNQARGVLNLPVAMRSQPSISISNMVVLGGNGYDHISSATVQSFNGTSIGIIFVTSEGDISNNTPYLITNDGDGIVDISADL